MIKYFYQVEYAYEENGKRQNFNLGVFSTLKNANKKVSLCKNQLGFSKYPDGFEITKFGVNFKNNIVKKTGIHLFFIYHEYSILEEDEWYDYWVQFDCFSTYFEAKSKLAYLKKHTRLGKKYPDNFMIDKVIVDNYNDWAEGFVSWRDK